MFKKIVSAMMCAAVLCTTSVTSFAESGGIPTSESVVISVTKATEWNGKTKLESGKEYVVSKNITISKKMTIPSKATVTVEKGAKITVSSKGSLYVKGTLEIEKGATLSVKGKLYEYKSKTINNYGTISFGSKANVTIKGKLNNKSTGVIKGTPKKVTVSSTAVISNSGKNSTKKLNKYIDSTAIEKKLENILGKIAKDLDIYSALKEGLPRAMLDELEIVFPEAFGMGFKEFCDLLKQEYELALKEEGFDMETIKSVDVKITKLTEIKTLDSDAKATADMFYSGWTKVYEVQFDLTAKTSAGNTTSEPQTISVIFWNGDWYLLA
ncbi:MAG: hypothetical protein J6A16_02850 [Oscillospiraceae bacterium]|nr:hypothetical protein [Oscillospiraceae bacterium]